MSTAAYFRTLNFIRHLDTEQLHMQTGGHLTNIRFIHALETADAGHWYAIYAGTWEGRRVLVTAHIYTNLAAAQGADCREIAHTLTYLRQGSRTRAYGVVWTWVRYSTECLIEHLRDHGAADAVEATVRCIIGGLEPELRDAA